MSLKRLVLALGLLSLPAFADPARQIGSAGAWRVFEAHDEMTDVKWYGAIAAADSGGDRLQISCHPPLPTLDVVLNSTTFLGDGYRDVDYRVDQHRPNTSHQAYSKKLVDLPAWFVTDAKDSKSVLIRFRTYDYTTIDRRFSLDGFDQAVRELRTYCPEKPAPAPPPPRRPPTKPRSQAAAPPPGPVATNPCWRPRQEHATVHEAVAEEMRFRRCMDAGR